MEKQYIRKEKTKKIFIEYFTIDDSGKISVQSRKFNDINKAYYFVDTLPQRGVLEGNIKIIIDFSFEPDTKDIKNVISSCIEKGGNSLKIQRLISASDKETLTNAGFEVSISKDLTEISWNNPKIINNLY